MKKIRVGLLFGGKSAEHEVSLQSAKNVYEALDKNKYEVLLLGIDKAGRWYVNDAANFLLNANDPKQIAMNPSKLSVGLVAGERKDQLVELRKHGRVDPVDVVFPALHGTYGEDGTVQGLLKLAGIPFVGASVLGSAVGMDKDVMKRLLRDAGIPIADFVVLHSHEKENMPFAKIVDRVGLPFFVKPANLGSSVGIHKVHDEHEFMAALEDAFRYDTKIIIEENIVGREIEISVLGNENPVASLPGEVLPHHDFYSYEAKYIDNDGAGLEIPAKVDDSVVTHVQELAVKAFRVLCCEGMARVDFFLKKNNELIVNEINTVPGFTKISMYPKLWDVSGIRYAELIDRLIELAIERHQREQKLATSFPL